MSDNPYVSAIVQYLWIYIYEIIDSQYEILKKFYIIASSYHADYDTVLQVANLIHGMY